MPRGSRAKENYSRCSCRKASCCAMTAVYGPNCYSPWPWSSLFNVRCLQNAYTLFQSSPLRNCYRQNRTKFVLLMRITRENMAATKTATRAPAVFLRIAFDVLAHVTLVMVGEMRRGGRRMYIRSTTGISYYRFHYYRRSMIIHNYIYHIWCECT